MGTVEDRLLSGDDVIELSKVVDLIADHIRIGADTGRFILTPQFETLSPEHQIVVVLLGQKAREQVDEAGSDQLPPEGISQIMAEPIGQVYPVLRQLEQDGIVENRNGQYRVPARSFDQVSRMLG